MKKKLLCCFIFFSAVAGAQTIESIHVNLYTDSLKKGTYNYINIDGRLSNGRYIPLDTSQLQFTSSAGKFSGNNLWIDGNFADKKVAVTVVVKNNPSLQKAFDIWIKQLPDGPLKTEAEIMNEAKNKSTKRNRQS